MPLNSSDSTIPLNSVAPEKIRTGDITVLYKLLNYRLIRV